jgi:chromate transporter
MFGWWSARASADEEPASGVAGLWGRLGLGLLPFLLVGLLLCNIPGVAPGYARLAGVSAFAVLTSFGGAYAALSLWRKQADVAGWLPAHRFGDALVVGEATPGPLMLAGSFIGFVAGYQGLLGGGAGWMPALVGLVIPAVFTFGISTALILAVAPLGEIGVASVRFRGAMSFVTATAAGALAWMAAMLVLGGGGRPVPVMLTLAAIVVTQRRRLGVLPLLAIGASCGWLAG